MVRRGRTLREDLAEMVAADVFVSANWSSLSDLVRAMRPPGRGANVVGPRNFRARLPGESMPLPPGTVRCARAAEERGVQ